MDIIPAQIKGLVMGLSGYDSQRDHDYFMDVAILSGVERNKIFICNDCELTFFAEGNPPGLSVVAGTGSISTGIARDFGRARSGGWGSSISDEGSGGWIGISVIRDLLRYNDGYGEYQQVFSTIREYLGEKTFDSLPGILSQYSVKELANLAKLVMDKADNGDEYCSLITAKAAEHIAEISYSVYKKLKFACEPSVDVVMSGSLFKSTFFCDLFIDTLKSMAGKDNINFCNKLLSPVMGGITLASVMFH